MKFDTKELSSKNKNTFFKKILLEFKNHDTNFLMHITAITFIINLIFDNCATFCYCGTSIISIKGLIYMLIILTSIISIFEIIKNKTFKLKNILFITSIIIFIAYKINFFINNIDTYYLTYPKLSTWIFKTLINQETILICSSLLLIVVEFCFRKIKF